MGEENSQHYGHIALAGITIMKTKPCDAYPKRQVASDAAGAIVGDFSNPMLDKVVFVWSGISGKSNTLNKSRKPGEDLALQNQDVGY